MLNMELLYEDAEKGVVEALKILGDVFLNGYEKNEITPDLQKAIGYYEKAAEGGMEDAYMDLGYIYCSGQYMEPDYEKGLGYYKQAADMGNTTAMGNLGMSYCKGLGVEQDVTKGFEYFLMAAEGGHPDAMEQVANFYRIGYGTEANQERADYWEKQAKIVREQMEADKEKGNAEKSPAQLAFEANLKFISKDTLDVELVKYIFEDKEDFMHYTMGPCAFPTGAVLTADPLCYLQSPRNVAVKEKHIKPGSYPVEMAIMQSDLVGLRNVAARLKVSEKQAVSYELAKTRALSDESPFAGFAGFPVEAGMGCFCDANAAQSYWNFLKGWYAEHEDGNIYDDYFAELFAQSYQENPKYQREGGDLLLWKNPLDGTQIPMFASGLGDGFYTDYWGMDENGEICELVIVFMNPELF